MPDLATHSPATGQPDIDPWRRADRPSPDEGDGRSAVRETARNVAGYVAAAGLASLALVLVMRLWRADLRIPLAYGTDAFFTAMQVRGVLENGWYLSNPRLGAPWGCELHDFPLSDSLHFALLKLLALFGCDHFLATNLYFLLTFPLSALSAYAVARRLGRRRLSSLVVALLFAFLPFHFYRSLLHLFLAAYYLVPPMALVALWLWEVHVPLLGPDEDGRARLVLLSPRSLVGVVVCLLVSSAGVYFAFFGCFFLCVAGLAGWAWRRRPYPFLAGLLLAGVIVAGGLANGLPHLLYQWRHGPNEQTRRTNYASAETYGLKLAPLVLPLEGHRLPWLADLRRRYDSKQPINEVATSTMGLTASLGLLFLLGRLLVRRPSASPPGPEEGLSVLAGAGLLLGTVGGLGSLLALLVVPSIRCYNRLSVYLAFFGLLAFAGLLERLLGRYRGTRRGGLLLGVAVLGILDQTNRGFVPPYAALKAMHDGDAGFVRRVESALPPGAMVFQLPYFPFPEVAPPGKLNDYDHLRGYLYSGTLRWSYGAIKGRSGDAWQASIAALPLEEGVRRLAFAGFAGVYVDRDGYDDRAGQVERTLRRLLDPEPITSRDGRLLFFRMAAYRDELRRHYSPRQWEHNRQQALHPVTFAWRDGFCPEEKGGGACWRWCCSDCGVLEVLNEGDSPRAVELRFRLAIPLAGAGTVHVDGPFLREDVRVGPAPGPAVRRTVTVGPGRHLVRFTSDVPPTQIPPDPRTFFFQVVDFRARDRLEE